MKPNQHQFNTTQHIMKQTQVNSNKKTHQTDTTGIKLNNTNMNRIKFPLISSLSSRLSTLFSDVPTSDAPVIERKNKPCLGSRTLSYASVTGSGFDMVRNRWRTIKVSLLSTRFHDCYYAEIGHDAFTTLMYFLTFACQVINEHFCVALPVSAIIVTFEICLSK